MGLGACDIAIIGGGPAGLSAAVAAASAGLDTVLFETLREPGDLAHPCSAVIMAIPGLVDGQVRADGLWFEDLDLLIPSDVITGQPTVQRYISPGGYEFRAAFQPRDDLPLASIDKAALLRRLAERARAAGASFRFGQPVTGLIEDAGRIVGVQTRAGEMRAQVVIAAEGVSRMFSDQARLYAHSDVSYAFVVNKNFDAPAVAADHIGQITTFGQRYTSAPQAFGTVVMPRPGRAQVYFSIFGDLPKLSIDESLWYYLDEYLRHDPRVRSLFADATLINRAGCRLVLRDAPTHVVCPGFIGAGDAITPRGHVGIVPSLYLGRHAALTAAAAIRAGDTSERGLRRYEDAHFRPILRGVEVEGRIMMGLTRMTDVELDRVCQTLQPLNIAPFFYGDPAAIIAEAARWVVKELPHIGRDWKLLRRLF